MGLTARIEHEKQNILFGNVTVATISAIVTEIAVCAVLWSSINPTTLIAWFTYMLFCTGVQLVGVYSRRVSGRVHSKTSLYCYFAGCSIEALGWGLAMHLLFPANPELQAFLTIVLVSVAIAALPIFCAYFPLYLSFTVAVMAGISTKFALLGTTTGFTMFALSLILLWILFDLGKRYSETLGSSLTLRFENEELADRALLAKAHVEATNKELSQEIIARKEVEARLKEAKEKAEAANHAKGIFLANVSHELRTPLNAIIGYSELLQEEVKEQEGRDCLLRDLGQIQKAGKHLLSLVEGVLDLAKSESSRTNLNLSSIHLGELLEAVIATATPLVQKNANTLEVKMLDTPSSLTLATDETKLRQILLNLLTNAAKFTHQGKIQFLVKLETQNASSQLLFKVIDSGIGISEKALSSLFEPFFQAQSNYAGTGLGLAISYNYAKLLGGKLCVSSELGQGSTFALTLPVAK